MLKLIKKKLKNLCWPERCSSVGKGVARCENFPWVHITTVSDLLDKKRGEEDAIFSLTKDGILFALFVV
jgi:hypothetical protein